MLQQLEEDGLADSTIVFYFADHGRPHVRDKQFLYDGGIRVPMIVRDPRADGVSTPGRVVDDLTSTIDNAATALALAALARPESMQGRVHLGPDADTPRDRIFAARDRCDGTFDRIRCVRTARWKYLRNFHPDRPYTHFNGYKETQYPTLPLLRDLHDRRELGGAMMHFMDPHGRPADELYDLAADPHELDNLADDPRHAQTLRDLRADLEAWMRATGDDRTQPEPPEKLRAEWDRMIEYYHRLGGTDEPIMPPLPRPA